MAYNSYVPPLTGMEIEQASLAARSLVGLEDDKTFHVQKHLLKYAELMWGELTIMMGSPTEMDEDFARLYPRSKKLLLQEESYHQAGLNRPRMRFTLAHEWAHIALHRQNLKRMSGNLDQPDMFVARAPEYVNGKTKFITDMEAQADYFAACILMPHHLLEPLTHLGVDAVANHFLVSKTTAKKRIRTVENTMGKTGRPVPEQVQKQIDRLHRQIRGLQGA